MTTITTFNAGKAVMKVPAIEKPMDAFLDVRLPKSEFSGKLFVIDADKILEIILNTAISTRGFRIAWTIDRHLLFRVQHSIRDFGSQTKVFLKIFGYGSWSEVGKTNELSS